MGRTNYVFEIGDSRYSAVNTGVYIGVETAYAANETGTYCKLGSYCRWNRKTVANYNMQLQWTDMKLSGIRAICESSSLPEFLNKA